MSAGTVFRGHLQHGWVTPMEAKASYGLMRSGIERFGVHLTWSSSGATLAREMGLNALAVGSPWAWFLSNRGIPKAKVEIGRTEGAIYFPQHSLADQVASKPDLRWLRRRFPDVSTVCLFWVDFLDPDMRRVMEDQGLRVVCAGYRGDSRWGTPWSPVGGRRGYLENLFSLLTSHDYVVVDHASTSMLYAASMNVPVRLSGRLQSGDSNRSAAREFHEYRDDYFERALGGVAVLETRPEVLLEWARAELGFNLVTQHMSPWEGVDLAQCEEVAAR